MEDDSSSNAFVNSADPSSRGETNMTDITRRSWLAQSGLLSAVVPPFTAGDVTGEQLIARDKQLRVVVVGAHPDDPESSCGGTMSRYADLGHEVIAVYLTRGEAGIKGKTAKQAAAIRTAEAESARVPNSESAPYFRRASRRTNGGQRPALSGIQRTDRSSKAGCRVCTVAH
jgi:GlcNAc-PI de-N-acetylase